jgi:hypothetical protein
MVLLDKTRWVRIGFTLMRARNRVEYDNALFKLGVKNRLSDLGRFATARLFV